MGKIKCHLCTSQWWLSLPEDIILWISALSSVQSSNMFGQTPGGKSRSTINRLKWPSSVPVHHQSLKLISRRVQYTTCLQYTKWCALFYYKINCKIHITLRRTSWRLSTSPFWIPVSTWSSRVSSSWRNASGDLRWKNKHILKEFETKRFKYLKPCGSNISKPVWKKIWIILNYDELWMLSCFWNLSQGLDNIHWGPKCPKHELSLISGGSTVAWGANKLPLLKDDRVAWFWNVSFCFIIQDHHEFIWSIHLHGSWTRVNDVRLVLLSFDF